jgi:hypothetical protein
MSRIKTYLNRQERDDLKASLANLDTDEKILNTWELRTNEHKYLKLSVTYKYKWLDSLLSRLGEDLAKQLLRDLKSNEVVVLPKLQAEKEIRRREEAAKYVEVKRETLLNLAEHALIGCENCKRKDYYNCDLRDAFVKLNIEPFDCYAVDKCQYSVEKGK